VATCSSGALSHPNVAAVYHCAMRRAPGSGRCSEEAEEGGYGASADGCQHQQQQQRAQQLVVVTEYFEMGTLQMALKSRAKACDKQGEWGWGGGDASLVRVLVLPAC
jgi:hypothetical protein